TGTRWDVEQAGKGSPAPSTGGSKPAGDPALSPVTAGPKSTPTENQAAAGVEALYSLSLTVGKGFAEKLEEARAQLSHSLPDGNLARILELGLDALLTDARRRRRAERIQDRRAGAPGEEASTTQEERPRPQARRKKRSVPNTAAERLRFAAPTDAPAEAPAAAGKKPRLDAPAPRVASPADAPFSARAPTAPPRPSDHTNTKRSRHITAEVRRRVWARDESRCTYVDGQGRRCGSRWFVQIDHVQPFARGGDNTVTNLRLLCGAHNRQRQATS
ncbi:MAG: hypothetical protein CME06_08885, partial [Gemmatimonadetes bacterium]|nr:hypothetical protein [Gemmatimonadota bacterium]